ncbi:MAG TPA: hypothetical protein GX513_03845, partial [Firmicutes bacterium]|nr:hypothetical protein [Bacillota bacterium]
ETQAQQRTQASLRFSNAMQVKKEAPWAAGYLDVALADGLLPAATVFQPNKPADRLWVAVMLVKAMGLEAEAEASADTSLPFRDAHLIPADLVGYVAVAVQHGIVAGYDDKTFRPNKPVTRLEMAALLDRADFWLPPRSDYQVKGTIVATDADDSTITLDVYRYRWWPWPRWWPIRPWPPIYWPADEAQLQSQGLASGSGLGVVDDSINAIGSAEANGSIKVMPPIPGPIVRRETYSVSKDALILLNHEPADLGDLPAGAAAYLVLNTSKVAVVIDARSGYVWPQPPPVVEEVEGTVQARTQNSITLRLENGSQVSYQLAANVQVRYRGEEVGLDAVKVGDRVELRVETRAQQRLVTRITIQEREAQEVEGTVVGLYLAGDDGESRITVRTEDGDQETYVLASDVRVSYRGERVSLSEIQVGDKVELRIEEQDQEEVVTRIAIEERETEEVTGTVVNLTIGGSGQTSSITVRTEEGTSLTYQLAAKVEVRYQGKEVPLSEIRVGDGVELRVQNRLVNRITIQEREHEEEEFSGTISVFTTGSDGTVSLTVYEGDKVLTAALAANAEILYDGEPLPVDELRVGDQVELELQDGIIVKVVVEERTEATVTGTVQDITQEQNRWTIKVKDSAGNVLSYQLSSRVRIRFEGELVAVGDLEDGDRVQIQVAGGLVYRIDILSRS